MIGGRWFLRARWLRSVGLILLGLTVLAIWSVPVATATEVEKKATKSADDDLQKLADELDAAEEEEECDEEKAEDSSTSAPTTRPRTIVDAATRRRLQAKEQRERLTKDPKWQPTHEQTGRFEIGSPLNNFCLDSKGRVLACCGDCKIRVFSQEGELVETWDLEFAPQAVGLLKADGTVFVGGEGQLAKLSPAGSVLLQKPFPRPMTVEEIEEAVQKQVKTQKKTYDDYLRGIRAQLAEVEKSLDEQKKAADASQGEDKPNPVNPLGGVAGMTSGADGFRLVFKDDTPLTLQRTALQQYVKMIDQQYGGAEKLAASIRSRMKSASRTATFTGLAVADKELFVNCSGAGYGYNAWRLNHDFQEETLIVKGLRGCCRQMDCQTYGGDLWIPMNTQHKVYRYDRDGEVLSTFGKRDREAADGFGGCCEPKNMRFGEGGSIYCAESGPPVCVKRFTADGQFQNVVCYPVYETGCVRVSVDMSGDKLFLMSPNENAIYVFEPKQET